MDEVSTGSNISKEKYKNVALSKELVIVSEEVIEMPKKIEDNEIKHFNIRRLLIKNYIAFYRIDESKRIVRIERILYGASNWMSNL